jgi:hypothetical protein
MRYQQTFLEESLGWGTWLLAHSNRLLARRKIKTQKCLEFFRKDSQWESSNPVPFVLNDLGNQ